MPQSPAQGSHLPCQRTKASERSTVGLGRGGSNPRLRFAGLSTAIRGHSHPTMREELEKGGEARQAHASNSSSHYRVSHTAQAESKLYTQLKAPHRCDMKPMLSSCHHRL